MRVMRLAFEKQQVWKAAQGFRWERFPRQIYTIEIIHRLLSKFPLGHYWLPIYLHWPEPPKSGIDPCKSTLSTYFAKRH